MTRLLVIDDNDLDRKILRDLLSHEGYEVEEAPDGAAGLRLLYDCRPELIILDVMMPEMDGWTTCARIRQLCDTPVIMLTSLNREEEMARGLDLGADDFVSKPVGAQHLLARVRAVLRRSSTQQRPAELLYDDGVLCIDAAKHEVTLAGKPVDLTPTEFRLLVALAAAPDRLHAYAELLQSVWGPEYVDDIDFLRVYVWRLRKKLETNPSQPRWLSTERGFGYRFVGHPHN
ncbi:MAG: response regulator transcription factor [Dehalococcoidia bacterium]